MLPQQPPPPQQQQQQQHFPGVNEAAVLQLAGDGLSKRTQSSSDTIHRNRNTYKILNRRVFLFDFLEFEQVLSLRRSKRKLAAKTRLVICKCRQLSGPMLRLMPLLTHKPKPRLRLSHTHSRHRPLSPRHPTPNRSELRLRLTPKPGRKPRLKPKRKHNRSNKLAISTAWHHILHLSQAGMG